MGCLLIRAGHHSNLTSVANSEQSWYLVINTDLIKWVWLKAVLTDHNRFQILHIIEVDWKCDLDCCAAVKKSCILEQE